MVALCYSTSTVTTPNETRRLTSVTQALGNCTDYGRYLANTIKQKTLRSFKKVNISPRTATKCAWFSALARDEMQTIRRQCHTEFVREFWHITLFGCAESLSEASGSLCQICAPLKIGRGPKNKTGVIVIKSVNAWNIYNNLLLIVGASRRLELSCWNK